MAEFLAMHYEEQFVTGEEVMGMMIPLRAPRFLEYDEHSVALLTQAYVTIKKEDLGAILRFCAKKSFRKDHLKDMQENNNRSSGSRETYGCHSIQDKQRDSEAPSGKDEARIREMKMNAKDKRVLGAGGSDEITKRAPEDEVSQVGAAKPSIGGSLRNAFKWTAII